MLSNVFPYPSFMFPLIVIWKQNRTGNNKTIANIPVKEVQAITTASSAILTQRSKEKVVF